MGKIRRKFDIQFKTQVCQAIESGTHRVADICRDNQLQRSMVDGWMRRYTSGALTAGPSNRERELERENEKLKAKVGELTMTVDLLKKMENWKNQLKSANSSIVTSRSLGQYQPLVKP